MMQTAMLGLKGSGLRWKKGSNTGVKAHREMACHGLKSEITPGADSGRYEREGERCEGDGNQVKCCFA